MLKLLSLVFVLGLCCSCFSQVSPSSANQASPTPTSANDPSWAKLSTLHTGQRIQIIDTSSKKLSGTFASVSETAIAYRQNADQKLVERQDVRTIKLMENRHRLRNTLIFAGIGAGAGAGIGAASVQQTGSIILSVSRGKEPQSAQ